MGDMDVQLLVVRGCHNEAVAARLLRTALDDVGLPDKDFDTTVVVSQDDADRRGFVGSPAFFVDGIDLFPEPERPSGFSCRLYGSLNGIGGVPDLVDLSRELRRAADRQ
jgi:hypothetical protein